MRRIAELKLLELIISLRNFAPHKSMALTCSMLLNLVTCDETRSKRRGSPSDFDIYFQNFFIYILRELEEMSNNIQLSEDLVPIIELRAAIDLVEEICTHFEQSTKDALMSKLNSIGALGEPSSTRNLQTSENRIDLDKLVYILLEEYITSKRKLEVDIVESFLNKFQTDKGKV
jgi:hypothetical protein